MPVMTDARELTVQTWRLPRQGRRDHRPTSPGRLLANFDKLRFRGLPEALLPGPEGTVELTAHTFWESPAAIRAFAGAVIMVAIVEPEARAMLLDFDRTVTHRSVAADARG